MAKQLTHLGIAQELIQVRTGHNIGRKTALGFMVHGKEETIKREMEDVLLGLTREGGERMRREAAQVRDEIREDVESGGSYREMIEVGKLGDDAAEALQATAA